VGEAKVLAVDVGTSALKAVAFSRTGAIVAVASRPVETRQPGARMQEQDPDAWWSALLAALAEIPGRGGVEALVFTGSMQNLVMLDDGGRALAPAILYSDRRLEEDEVSALAARLPADYGERVGNRLDPAHTILKLMARERFLPPARRERAVRFTFGAKDAVAFRLTGRFAIDPTTASTTGMMDIHARRWDEDLVALARLSGGRLPSILPADAVLGAVTAEAARETGLCEGARVFNGAGDAAAATWGAFADAPGTAYAYLGTTGWVAATLALADAAPPREIYTLADPVRPDMAIIVSPFLTAGGAMDWLAELTGRSVEALIAAAAEERAHEWPLFLPYLSGERAPFEDSGVRGAFLGLDRRHGAGALARSVMEGVAFAVRHNLETAGLPPSPLTVIGGAARHAAQRRILADALARDVEVPDDSLEMTALGALRMIEHAAGLDLAATGGAQRIICDEGRAAWHARRYCAYLAASRLARQEAAALA